MSADRLLTQEEIDQIELLRRMSPVERRKSAGLSALAELDREAEAFEVRYQEYIHSPQWKEKADAAKAAAGNRCQVCYGEHQIEAHHRTYRRLGHELPTDITVLCDDCHELFHKNRRLQR